MFSGGIAAHFLFCSSGGLFTTAHSRQLMENGVSHSMPLCGLLPPPLLVSAGRAFLQREKGQVLLL